MRTFLTPVIGLRAALLGIVLWALCSGGAFAQSPPASPPAERGAIDCRLLAAGCPPAAGPTARTVGRPEPARPGEEPAGWRDALGTFAKDFAHFPNRQTLAWVGGGASLSVVGSAGDRAAGYAHRRVPLFGAGARIGCGEVQFGAAVGTYALGRLTGRREISALGFQLLRANVLAQGVTQGVKLATRRDRPDGGGLSFPSGHTSTTFAAATVLQRRYGWKAGLPAYLLASYVAASRVSDRRHYPSDVIFGAGIGIAAGLTVTRRDERKAVFAPVVVPGGAGAVWMKSW